MAHLKVIASCNRSSKNTSLDVHPVPHVDLDGAVSDRAVSAPELFAAGDTEVDISTVDAVCVASPLAWQEIRQEGLKV